MLGTIFSFETKRWLKNWQFYLYVALFFSLAFFLMASALGYFEGFGATVTSNVIVNSPIAINSIINQLSQFVNFIIPTVIGATVYRDFKYNTHSLLYAYPFNKSDYLLGKFFSGFIITVVITFFIGLGLLVASVLPMAKAELLGPLDLWPYIQSFILFVIPNVFFIGALVFMLVTLTRNLYIGFIFVVILLILQLVIANVTNNMDDKFLAALIEPYGNEALQYVTKYWTIEEKNYNDIPWDKVILYNRLIWIGVGLLAMLVTYLVFSFSHSPITLKKKKVGARFVKNNFSQVTQIKLPEVVRNYSFGQNLKNAFALSRLEYKSIVKNWIFISFMVVMMLFIIISGYSLGQELFGTRTYPVTWKIVDLLENNLAIFLSMLIYLFSGVLLNNAINSRMNLLVDATPIPNWTLLVSKVIALLKMTLTVMVIAIISGILIQMYYGYFNFELGIYFMKFFVYGLISFFIIILFSLFVQSFFKNYFLGFMLLLVTTFIPLALTSLGFDLPIYSFNSGSIADYSDMDKFGVTNEFFYFKLYWFLFVAGLFVLTLLFYRRGIFSGAKERLATFGQRLKPAMVLPLVVFFGGFVAMGFMMYNEYNAVEPHRSAKESEERMVYVEKTYGKYKHLPTPRITDVNVDMQIFPKERNYKAVGKFVMVNKTDKPIETLYLNADKTLKSIEIDRKYALLKDDKDYDIKLYKLEPALMPGEKMNVTMVSENLPNSWLFNRSPVIQNGTFINNFSLFPSFGYNPESEIVDNDIRKKYGLNKKERMPNPTDPHALENTYISHDADWINFETTVSTSDDQIAIAPGYLQKQWTKDGRKYFHYKMDQPMLNFYAFNSGKYEVKKEKRNDVNLEIYYQKGHEYNLDRMMKALRNSIAYYSENFGPYQHKQARIIEFPRTMGTFAQSFANTIPFSEAIGFIAKVDENDPNGVDYAFSVVSHEIAHQWWAHQVIGANVKGATMLSESLSEYSSLKVLEKEYGKFQMRKFLKEALDKYLQGRSFEWKEEQPLIANENQQYIHYDKGSLVMYAMSDYLGEKVFNNFLKDFVSQKKFQQPPYTTSLEFVALLKKYTPEHLQYLIKDMYETITLYDNYVESVKTTKLPNGKYEVTIEFVVSKYRTNLEGKPEYKDESGKTLNASINKKSIQSLPMNDYIEVGVFGEKTKKNSFEYENELYNKKYLIKGIRNQINIIVDKKPIEVGVDPYNKLIDRNSIDNRKNVN